jgi:hypothetical protein
VIAMRRIEPLQQARILKDFGVKDVPQKIRDVKDIHLPAVYRLLKSTWVPKSTILSNFEEKNDLLIIQIVGCYKYLAETSDGETILVKFVRQYFPDRIA